MRTVLAAMTALLLAAPALAENPSPHSGMRTFVTGKPYAAYLDELTASVWANGMGIVAQACADCGAKSLGVTIPGNRVVEVFDPGFAVRMLKASTAAGIEAPLRLYVTENPDGTATLTYRLPSAVFAPYGVPALDQMAMELDFVFKKIVDDSLRN